MPVLLAYRKATQTSRSAQTQPLRDGATFPQVGRKREENRFPLLGNDIVGKVGVLAAKLPISES